MKTSKETIAKVVRDYTRKSYSFIDKFAEILADNINDYVEDGGTIQDWFDDYNRGGISSGFIPQLIYNSDIYPIFEKHYKDLFDWLDDFQTELGEEISLIDLNDGGRLPINIIEYAFDWFVGIAFEEIDEP